MLHCADVFIIICRHMSISDISNLSATSKPARAYMKSANIIVEKMSRTHAHIDIIIHTRRIRKFDMVENMIMQKQCAPHLIDNFEPIFIHNSITTNIFSGNYITFVNNDLRARVILSIYHAGIVANVVRYNVHAFVFREYVDIFEMLYAVYYTDDTSARPTIFDSRDERMELQIEHMIKVRGLSKNIRAMRDCEDLMILIRSI